MSNMPTLNRDNLKTARENMGLTTLTATKKISTSKNDLVLDWESGASVPNWSQVIKLAKVYNISELLFFGEQNIPKNKNIPDYRVGASPESLENVNKLINVVVSRQKWLQKSLIDQGWSKNRLLGSGQSIKSPHSLALFIQERLNIEISEIKEKNTKKEALGYLIRKAEEGGIFVGKTISYHKLDVNDMRGLFISNDYCPYIILNRKDALSAQIFSFIHELAHFFRKSDALSNSLEFRASVSDSSDEEIFCNRVAAELLLPTSELTKYFYDKSDINNISEIYKVSPLFIFYRLKELGKIPKERQISLEREIQRETEENLKLKAEQDAAKEGGNYINSMRDSNGSLFNRVVVSSYLENNIGYVEAANLLRFSPEKV